MNKPLHKAILPLVFLVLCVVSFKASDFYYNVPDGLEFFLTFPRNDKVVIYTDNNFSSENTLGYLNRGVVMNPREKETGVVEVSTESGTGFLKLADLRLLPPEGNTALVTEWEKTLSRMGLEGSSWSVSYAEQGLKQVSFVLQQNRHIRAWKYLFTTDGEKVIEMEQKKLKNGFISGPFFLLSGLFFILTLIFGFRAIRKTS